MQGYMINLQMFLRTIWGRLCVVIVVTLAFLQATKTTYNYAHKSIVENDMAALSAQLLERTELAADFAILTLVDLTAKSLGNCKSETLAELRQEIYLRGSVKDVIVLNSEGTVICSGLPRSLDSDFIDLSLGQPFVGKNKSIEFHKIAKGETGILGIAWRFKTFTAVAVLNVDALLFDAFPPALRDYSTARISFDGKENFAIRDGLPKTISGTSVDFGSRSERYPLYAELSVTPKILWSYDRKFETQSILLGGLLGLAFALLIAQLLARPADPRTAMKHGLKNNQFVPYIQPLFSLATRRVIGGEALVRWVKPDGTIVPPTRFIPLAEDSGLIIPMTRAVIAATLNQIGDIMQADRSLKISFNIVPADLCSPNFLTEITTLINASKVAPSQIVLELTERQEFENSTEAAAVVKELQDLGIRTALDDTGTGHNGLSYVQDLGADIIKIDKKFVDFVSDNGGGEIVDMLVKLAKSMDMRTIAEGIETEEQARVLTDLGVDEGQGYLIAKPLPPSDFIDLVERQTNRT